MADAADPPAPPAGRAQRYEALDAIRGVCAIVVMVMHSRFLTGIALFPSAYMAVDLFFIMSGFVLANAYDARLRRGGYFRTFLLRRYARLLPMWIIGLSIGSLAPLALVMRGHIALPTFILEYFLSAFFVIDPQQEILFSYDSPGWSLFFELFANIFYALSISLLGLRSLVAIVGLAVVGLFAAVLSHGSLDGGQTLSSLGVGFARVAFGFLLGVLIYHLPRPKAFTRIGWYPLIITLACIVALFYLAPPLRLRPWYDLSITIVVLPLIVWIGLKSRLSGSWLANALGILSYPLYTIHFAVMFLLYWIVGIVSEWQVRVVPMAPIVLLMMLLVAGCYWLGRSADPALSERLAALLRLRSIRLPAERRPG